MVSDLRHIQTPLACLACLFLLDRCLPSQRGESPAYEAGGWESGRQLVVPRSTCCRRHRSRSPIVSLMWMAAASGLCHSSSSGVGAADHHRQASLVPAHLPMSGNWRCQPRIQPEAYKRKRLTADGRGYPVLTTAHVAGGKHRPQAKAGNSRSRNAAAQKAGAKKPAAARKKRVMAQLAKPICTTCGIRGHKSPRCRWSNADAGRLIRQLQKELRQSKPGAAPAAPAALAVTVAAPAALDSALPLSNAVVVRQPAAVPRPPAGAAPAARRTEVCLTLTAEHEAAASGAPWSEVTVVKVACAAPAEANVIVIE